MPRLTVDLTDIAFERLKKKRKDDKLEDKPWGEYIAHLIRDVHLTSSDQEMVGKATSSLLSVWLGNIGDNLPRIKSPEAKTVFDLERELVPDVVDKKKLWSEIPSIVIGAGPSIRKFNHLSTLSESRFPGFVLVSDKMLAPTLEAGVTPNRFKMVVLSLDAHPSLVPAFYQHEIVKKWGTRLRCVLSSTVSKNTAQAVEDAGIPFYWFNPQYDSVFGLCPTESLTRLIMLQTVSPTHPNGAASFSVLGNTGSGLIMFATAFLHSSPVALIGMDMGYYEETPPSETAYWHSFKDIDPNLHKDQFKLLWCPEWGGKELKLDLVFWGYRETLLNAVKLLPPWFSLVNCTGGGSIFGDGIRCVVLEEWLRENGWLG